ncbi:hypothetical protein LTR53_019574, partial [Teratosphaeriaceae sp. CCFEE 6253]
HRHPPLRLPQPAQRRPRPHPPGPPLPRQRARPVQPEAAGHLRHPHAARVPARGHAPGIQVGQHV